MKLILLSLFLLSSCMFNAQKSPMSLAEVDLKLTQEWVYATSVNDLKYNNEVISRPPGFEQFVMSLVIPTQGGLASKKHCLYYQVPYKDKIGRIRVQEVKGQEDCPETSNDEKFYVSLEDVNNFKITQANFKITLNFEIGKNKNEISIPTPNIETGLVHEKYRALTEKSLISGMRLLRLNEDSFDFASNKYLGQLSDRFARGTAIRCQQVNKDCENVGENRCGECRYGWYEVVDFQCPQGGSKFCGQNHCGEKNEPACPRGVKVVDPSEAGICQSDLEPVANADKILICQ